MGKRWSRILAALYRWIARAAGFRYTRDGCTIGNAETMRVDLTDMVPETGEAWIVTIGESLCAGDSLKQPRESALRLFEDGRPLGPPHSSHDLIRRKGGGYFSHWHDQLYFSTSDGSDPRVNGRIYHIETVENRPLYPIDVSIETINACNARCPFCPLFQGSTPMDRHQRPAMIMSDELFEKCVREIASWPQPPSALYLNTNGEPLLDPKFPDRLTRIGELGLGEIVTLNTNAQFLSPPLAKAILWAKVRTINIAFDGATKETYEAHRVRCDYDRVLANIRNFVTLRRELGGQTNIVIIFVRTGRNAHEVVDACNMFSGILDPDRDIFHDTLSIDWGERDGGHDDAFYYLPKVKHGRTHAHGCAVFDNQLIINSDGSVAACCMDYNLRVSDGGFGNVRDACLIDLWRGSKRLALQNVLRTGRIDDVPEKCQSCIYLSDGPVIDPKLAQLPEDRSRADLAGFAYTLKASD